MSGPSTSGLSVELRLLRVIDVKYGYFTLLYVFFTPRSVGFLLRLFICSNDATRKWHTGKTHRREFTPVVAPVRNPAIVNVNEEQPCNHSFRFDLTGSSCVSASCVLSCKHDMIMKSRTHQANTMRNQRSHGARAAVNSLKDFKRLIKYT